MSKVYERFDRATAHMSAWAILIGGKYAARVVIKHGASRVTAYVQVFGATMTSGYADGGGYDRDSAAVEAACAKLKQLRHEDDDAEAVANLRGFVSLMLRKTAESQGKFWYDRLNYAGSAFEAYNVLG